MTNKELYLNAGPLHSKAAGELGRPTATRYIELLESAPAEGNLGAIVRPETDALGAVIAVLWGTHSDWHGWPILAVLWS